MYTDLLYALRHAWETVCATYDVDAELPDMQTLFGGVDLSTSIQAAEAVLVNMLSEAMESICRFSPWYRKSATCFGLLHHVETDTHQTHWRLSADAVCFWKEQLSRLATAIEQNIALVLSVNTLNDFMEPAGLCQYVMARCMCSPPRLILVIQAILMKDAVICDLCQEPFALAATYSDPDEWAGW